MQYDYWGMTAAQRAMLLGPDFYKDKGKLPVARRLTMAEMQAMTARSTAAEVRANMANQSDGEQDAGLDVAPDAPEG